MLRVLKPGLETCVQDYPGRIGHMKFAFPRSGPMDDWSFRLANLLVGNEVGAAGLECQFTGPTLEFHRNAVIAITGADMKPVLDGVQVPMNESIAVGTGQTLQMKFAVTGARAYLAISGGIRAPLVLGSRATFRKAGIGGFSGRALVKGQEIPLANSVGEPRLKATPASIPPISTAGVWDIEVVRGPNDDWVDDAAHDEFFRTEWRVSSQSDRMGCRLVGEMTWTFTSKAYKKAPEHGTDPSNIIDQVYPPGAINIAGQTPIVLGRDGPTAGGFVCPYTVPRCGMWKLGQIKPAEILRFHEVSLADAQDKAREIERLLGENVGGQREAAIRRGIS